VDQTRQVVFLDAGVGVADHAAFADALGTIRGGIARFGEPFDALLAFVELPRRSPRSGARPVWSRKHCTDVR